MWAATRAGTVLAHRRRDSGTPVFEQRRVGRAAVRPRVDLGGWSTRKPGSASSRPSTNRRQASCSSPEQPTRSLRPLHLCVSAGGQASQPSARPARVPCWRCRVDHRSGRAATAGPGAGSAAEQGTVVVVLDDEAVHLASQATSSARGRRPAPVGNWLPGVQSTARAPDPRRRSTAGRRRRPGRRRRAARSGDDVPGGGIPGIPPRPTVSQPRLRNTWHTATNPWASRPDRDVVGTRPDPAPGRGRTSAPRGAGMAADGRSPTPGSRSSRPRRAQHHSSRGNDRAAPVPVRRSQRACVRSGVDRRARTRTPPDR